MGDDHSEFGLAALGDPFAVAAQRTRQSVMPAAGREISAITTLPEMLATSMFNRAVIQPVTAARDLTQQALGGRFVSDDPDNLARALGAASLATTGAMPFATRGAAGMGGGALVQPARAERFNWPVQTSYGKTIDMPITVNPSKSHIARALAEAPGGDVRALRAPDGSVYMWPANEAMHVDIANTFDLPFRTRADLQKSSYLFNRKDVDAVGKYTSFGDLIDKLQSADR